MVSSSALVVGSLVVEPAVLSAVEPGAISVVAAVVVSVPSVAWGSGDGSGAQLTSTPTRSTSTDPRVTPVHYGSRGRETIAMGSYSRGMMCTYLQQVTAEAIERLEAQPESINELDAPETFSTYYMATIDYFLTGSAYPGPERGPLALALMGVRNVPCKTLENGSFDVVPPERMGAIAAALQAVDVGAVEAAVAEADLDALVDDEEIDELIDMSPEEAAEAIAADVRGLAAFYAKLAERGAGVVIYTT